MGSMHFRVGAADDRRKTGSPSLVYRSRTIFGAVRDRGMVSALEHAGAVELSMRSWRFISGRRRCAVDRLEGPRSRRHQVFVSSRCGTAVGAMRRGSGRLGGAEGPHHASVGLCAVNGKILGCKLRTNPPQVSATRVMLGQSVRNPIRYRMRGLYDAPLPSYSPPLLFVPYKWADNGAYRASMGPLGAAEPPGAASHSVDGRATAGGHKNLMSPRTRALKTVDGAPPPTA